MNIITSIIAYVQSHWIEIVSAYTSVVGLASIIVRLTPTVKDDNYLKGILRFTGKYIALNTNKGSGPNV